MPPIGNWFSAAALVGAIGVPLAGSAVAPRVFASSPIPTPTPPPTSSAAAAAAAAASGSGAAASGAAAAGGAAAAAAAAATAGIFGRYFVVNMPYFILKHAR